MQIVIFILAVTNFICIIWLLLYRRQIRELCRRIAFLSAEDTNMLVGSELKSKDVVDLTEEVNKLLVRYRDMMAEYTRKDSNLKHTITSLSHDIRTPLTSLDGYFQLLIESEGAEKDRYIRIIRERIKSLSEILEEMFTYAKLQDDDYPLPLQRENVNEIVYEGIFPFYDDFKNAGMEPDFSIEETPMFAECNHNALLRVVHNIVKNSLVHSMHIVRIKLRQEESMILFECENDVEHPEQVDISMIFDRFYKADNARSVISSGLGLSIAKGLVNGMNGTIEASLNDNIFKIEFKLPIME